MDELNGDPVTNLDGQVIGLVTNRVPVTEPGAVVLANPAVLAEDLEANKVNNELGKIDKDYRAGVDAYTEGRYDDCIRSLDAVLAALPTHQHAQQLRQQAVALRELERGATGEPDNPRGATGRRMDDRRPGHRRPLRRWGRMAALAPLPTSAARTRSALIRFAGGNVPSADTSPPASQILVRVSWSRRRR